MTVFRFSDGANKSRTLLTGQWALGWLEKREVPKMNFSHADPGVFLFEGLKKVVKKIWGNLGLSKWLRRGTPKKIQMGS